MFAIVAHLSGALGLFFMGARLLTEHLKSANDRRLRLSLSRWTHSRLLGFAWGLFAGSIMQSTTVSDARGREHAEVGSGHVQACLSAPPRRQRWRDAAGTDRHAGCQADGALRPGYRVLPHPGPGARQGTPLPGHGDRMLRDGPDRSRLDHAQGVGHASGRPSVDSAGAVTDGRFALPAAAGRHGTHLRPAVGNAAYRVRYLHGGRRPDRYRPGP